MRVLAPRSWGFGSGTTCQRRLEEGNRAGLWQRPHELLAKVCAVERLWTGLVR